jgi:hypothetical protein
LVQAKSISVVLWGIPVIQILHNLLQEDFQWEDQFTIFLRALLTFLHFCKKTGLIEMSAQRHSLLYPWFGSKVGDGTKGLIDNCPDWVTVRKPGTI